MSKSKPIKYRKFIIPAKYILGCIADDPDTEYPVGVFIKSGRTESAMYLYSAKEIKEAMKSKDVFQCTLVRIGKKGKNTMVDLAYRGAYEADQNFMPERKDGDTFYQGQVRRLYALLFHPEDVPQDTQEAEVSTAEPESVPGPVET